MVSFYMEDVTNVKHPPLASAMASNIDKIYNTRVLGWPTFPNTYLRLNGK